MARTTVKQAPQLTSAEIKRRGLDLLERFRSAGEPQYTVWLIRKDPSIVKDINAMHRIRQLFNGAGAKKDAALLIKCEGLADQFLPQQAA